jgi:hypothetical protein
MRSARDPFNLLLVPFPYRITADCFEPITREIQTNRVDPSARQRENVHFFRVSQKWLDDRAVETRLTNFLVNLVDAAKGHLGSIHAIVMPELALTEELARGVGAALAKARDLELFISGIAGVNNDSGVTSNQTYCEMFTDGKHHTSWTQSKHHRWKLDARQVATYNLQHVLGEQISLYEAIDVSLRECSFHIFREGASLAVLVCEDLARIDPVQGVVRAVGPNLVITLLMDGPQLERRWPGRYATVLADDPGSAVLTLTSMGLMRRTDGVSNQIGLWKDPKGGLREIQLPDGCHGVALSLTPSFEEEFCSDWRTDNQGAMRLTLGEVFAVRGDTAGPWLGAR